MLPVTSGSMLCNKTSGWRYVKPLIDYDRCTGCMLCWKYCPEGTININIGKPLIEYDYCKGCGICAEECPQSAIAMKTEEK